jgi:hypothetical protein
MEPLRKPRARAPSTPRNDALARIHVLKKECRLTDDEYRDLIQTLTNGRTRSAGDCDFTERERIVAHFVTLKGALRIKGARPTRQPLSPMQKKVFALWKALETGGVLRSGEVPSLRAYIKRQVQLDAIEFCGDGACRDLIESLKMWAARTGVPLEH